MKKARNGQDEKKPSLSEVMKHAFSEEGIYESYFNKDFWSVEQFAALWAGITPELFLSTEKNPNVLLTTKKSRQIQSAFEIQRKFLKYIKGHSEEKIMSAQGTLWMSSWRFIKWMAMNQIPMRVCFYKCLPLWLSEIYQEFQPIDVNLRTKSRYSKLYHRAYYLKQAKKLIASSPCRLSREEIYNEPSMINLLRSFKKNDGTSANYKKRTVIDSWLKEIDPCKRGRPKKNLSK